MHNVDLPDVIGKAAVEENARFVLKKLPPRFTDLLYFHNMIFKIIRFRQASCDLIKSETDAATKVEDSHSSQFSIDNTGNHGQETFTIARHRRYCLVLARGITQLFDSFQGVLDPFLPSKSWTHSGNLFKAVVDSFPDRNLHETNSLTAFITAPTSMSVISGYMGREIIWRATRSVSSKRLTSRWAYAGCI